MVCKLWTSDRRESAGRSTPQFANCEPNGLAGRSPCGDDWGTAEEMTCPSACSRSAAVSFPPLIRRLVHRSLGEGGSHRRRRIARCCFCIARHSLRSACSLPYGSRTPARGGYASLLVFTSPMTSPLALLWQGVCVNGGRRLGEIRLYVKIVVWIPSATLQNHPQHHGAILLGL